MKTRTEYERELVAWLARDGGERERAASAAMAAIRAENEATARRREAALERIGSTGASCDAGRPWL
jgi:hypothetical protein